MSQTTAASYGSTLTKAEAGAKYDISPDTVVSYAAEAAIPFGRAVKRGTDKQKEVLLVAADTDAFFGVALKQQTIVIATGATPGYAQYDTVSVLEQGKVWVEVTSDVTAGAAAYVDVSNGKFTDVATDNLAVPSGTFETSAVSGGLAVLAIK